MKSEHAKTPSQRMRRSNPGTPCSFFRCPAAATASGPHNRLQANVASKGSCHTIGHLRSRWLVHLYHTEGGASGQALMRLRNYDQASVSLRCDRALPLASCDARMRGSSSGVEGGSRSMGKWRWGDEKKYRTDAHEPCWTCAEALREGYRAIIDAGLILQLDDPSIAENWDQINPEPSVADYQKFSMIRVEAINHAISGLPKDRIRFHLCWGSWHGPHTTDIPMRDIVNVMLAIDCQAYSFEAGNVRHEHEWTVWEDVKLPHEKIILPGAVSHATNVVEHPELVAQRIVRFVNLVGRENVIASTDCGLGGRVHPQIAWAKLESLVRGAELATQQLWR